MKIGNMYIEKNEKEWIVEALPQSSFLEKVSFLVLCLILWIKHKLWPGFCPVDQGDLRNSLIQGNVGIQISEPKQLVRQWERSVQKGAFDSSTDQIHQAFWLDSVNAILKSFWMTGWFISRNEEDDGSTTKNVYWLPCLNEGKISFKSVTGRWGAIQYTAVLLWLFVIRNIEWLLPISIRKKILVQRLAVSDLLPLVMNDQSLDQSLKELKVSIFMVHTAYVEGMFYPKTADEAFHEIWTKNPLGAIMAGMYFVGWFVPHYAEAGMAREGELEQESLTGEEMHGIYNTNLRFISQILGCDPKAISFE